MRTALKQHPADDCSIDCGCHDFLVVFLSENHFLLSKTCMKSTTYRDRPELLKKKKKITPDLLIIVSRFQIACILRLCFFCTCSGLKTDLILWLNAISWCTAHQHKTKASGWGLVQLRGWRVGPGVHFC